MCVHANYKYNLVWKREKLSPWGARLEQESGSEKSYANCQVFDPMFAYFDQLPRHNCMINRRRKV